MNPEMAGVTANLAGGITRGGAPAAGAQAPAPPKGAVHSAEIEYALGNLDGNKVYAWGPDDRKVSSAMEDYFANFIKTGNPNGAGLPKWPVVKAGGDAAFLHIDVETRAETEKHRDRYLLMDRLAVPQ